MDTKAENVHLSVDQKLSTRNARIVVNNSLSVCIKIEKEHFPFNFSLLWESVIQIRLL